MSATVTAIKMPGVTALPSFVPKQERDVMDTVLVHPERLSDWKRPGKIQRPLKLTNDIFALARDMQLQAANDPEEAWCEIPGVITLAKFEGSTYLLDGQHRLDGAFRLATQQVIVPGGVSVKCGLARVRVFAASGWAEMAQEFARINGQLVRTKPEDVLRAVSMGDKNLQEIEKRCPWIGYDRTGDAKKTILLAMPTAVRTWFGSGGLVPASGPTVAELPKFLTPDQTEQMVGFYTACSEAGWVNPAFQRLWGALNLCINMWLYRRVVLGQQQTRFHGGQKPMVLSREQFIECMAVLPQSPTYLEYLAGRSLRERDRVPCYTQIKDAYYPVVRGFGMEPRFPMANDWS